MSLRTLRFSLKLYRQCVRIPANIPQVRLLRTVDMGKYKGDLPTISQLTSELANIMGIEMGYKPIPKSREYLQHLIPTDRNELPPRTMKDSFMAGIIPLATDPILQEKYIGLVGQLRRSRLLEDMDIFSVVVAQKYLLNPRVKPGMHSPYTIVTILVDRIEFTEFEPKVHQDVRIQGHVSWVGVTSMEVVVWLDQNIDNEWHRITKAVCLLAIRDAINSKGVFTNILKPETEEEKKIFTDGCHRKEHRQKLLTGDIFNMIPTMEEQGIIHDLYKKSVISDCLTFKKTCLPPGCVWMRDCTLTSLMHTHPQNRNLHNSVFGGWLMRQATQISYTLGILFTKLTPVIHRISDIRFRAPVRITYVLKMHAYIAYTQKHFMQIVVYAETWDMSKDENVASTSFHFTYGIPHVLPEVIPRTYSEAMMYLSARRNFYAYNTDKLTFEPITTYKAPKSIMPQ